MKQKVDPQSDYLLCIWDFSGAAFTTLTLTSASYMLGDPRADGIIVTTPMNLRLKLSPILVKSRLKYSQHSPDLPSKVLLQTDNCPPETFQYYLLQSELRYCQ